MSRGGNESWETVARGLIRLCYFARPLGDRKCICARWQLSSDAEPARTGESVEGAERRGNEESGDKKRRRMRGRGGIRRRVGRGLNRAVFRYKWGEIEPVE